MKKKKLISALLLVCFTGLMLVFILGGLIDKKSRVILLKSHRMPNSELVTRLELNDMVPGVDAYMHRYTFPVRTEDEGKCIFLYAEAWDEEGKPLHTIIGNSDKNQCVQVNFDEEIDLLVYNETEYYEGTVRFTNLPVISLNQYDMWINTEKNNREQMYANVYVINPYFENQNSQYYFESEAEFFKRGNTAIYFPKPAYRLNLKKRNREQRINRSEPLLGMRNDDDWILDAAFTDPSRVRNKLASDFWNIITKTSESEEHYFLNSEFVELYVNSEFYGLYILKEPIDKKTLSLKEGDYLAEGYRNDIENVYGNPDVEIIEDVFWGGYQMVYPQEGVYYPYWQSMQELYEKINTLDTEQISDYEKYIDIDNVIDYYILLLLTCADDNSAKNIHVTGNVFNNKFRIIPWDLDLTFGLYFYPGAELVSKKDISNYIQIDDFYPVTELIESCSEQFYELVSFRWTELREGALSDDEIHNHVDNVYNYLTITDVLIKENKRWFEFDFAGEIREIPKWLRLRLEYIDSLYKRNKGE